MTFIVAVSGGVDSVVLLDMMVKQAKSPLVVAHFDHGIRPDSNEDALFVEALAKSYGLPFETKREELGEDASEALARDRRYDFLRKLSDRYKAKIVTAHHGDDLTETVAINVSRGTGWRGLAVLDSGVLRPLLNLRKDDIYYYANKYNLEWREDSTNSDDKYLRNKIRPAVKTLYRDEIDKMRQLRDRQIDIKKDIESEVLRVMGMGPIYSRYVITNIPKEVSMESLRVLTKGRLTRPQLERMLLAVKTSLPGTVYQAGSGVDVSFTTRYFTL